jgi:hypothetical protein
MPALRFARRPVAPGAKPEGIYDAAFPASKPPKSVATFSPPIDNLPKAVNILKTKGRDRAFSPPKADNILKQIHLQETMEIHK